jgi:hypothetical protein
MTAAPEVEEEVEATEEELEAQLDGKLIDAEVLLRHAWDLLDDLATGQRIPRKMVDQIEKLHDELVDTMPED